VKKMAERHINIRCCPDSIDHYLDSSLFGVLEAVKDLPYALTEHGIQLTFQFLRKCSFSSVRFAHVLYLHSRRTRGMLRPPAFSRSRSSDFVAALRPLAVAVVFSPRLPSAPAKWHAPQVFRTCAPTRFRSRDSIDPFQLGQPLRHALDATRRHIVDGCRCRYGRVDV